MYASLSFLILSHSISLSTFILRYKNRDGFILPPISFFIFSLTSLLGGWPTLGLLDSSYGLHDCYTNLSSASGHGLKILSTYLLMFISHLRSGNEFKFDSQYNRSNHIIPSLTNHTLSSPHTHTHRWNNTQPLSEQKL